MAFLRGQSLGFGLTDPDSELTLVKERFDPRGGAHLTFTQIYKGVPVFAAMLKTHFNPDGDLRAVNGVVVPDIGLNPVPSRTSEEAAAAALAKVQSDSPQASGLTIKGSRLYVYRTGLAQGVAGQNHLVWETEVSNSANTREFVYIDAHSGKFVDQLTGIYDALNRRVYDGENIPQYPPPNYPSNPFWVEGQQFPTGVAEADEVIAATKETYELFRNAAGRDSFDNAGSILDSIFNSGVVPGNAFADPAHRLVSYGLGFVTDDVVGHEWTHTYTYFANGLIYAWQPGALNEAYSDIFGETIDHHCVATEAGYDGGQVMISVNGGPFRLVAPTAFIYNGYSTTLFPAARGYEYLYNSRAGQPAFSGTDGASFKGSWGTSIVDLTPYAHSGDRIRLRWDLSSDYCFGTNQGWYVDDVRVYTCRP